MVRRHGLQVIHCILLASAVAPSFGQGNPAVNLTGIVSDSAGVPIAAATVHLENGGLTATSGPDGRFTLTGGVSIHSALPEEPIVAIREGWLFLSIPEKSTITITAHGLQGKTLFSMERNMDVGSHSLKLPDIGSGVRFFKMRSGMRETVIKAFSLAGALRSATFIRQESSPGYALLKQTGSAVPYYDVITATKAGYLKSYLSISNSDSSNIKIKMLKEGSAKFSFFVTSLKALVALSGSAKGFGGDLRFGETGPGAGLRGADKLCAAIAERSMPGSSFKGWRAFLSVPSDANGKQADAIDRIGAGPWYDRLGRLLAPTKADLLAVRPLKGDPTIQNDLPNEDGVPNKRPDPTKPEEDNHHFLTGSDAKGRLYGSTATCMNWTSVDKSSGRPRIGFSFPHDSRQNWLSGQDEGGCGAGVNLVETGGSDPNNPIVGSGGGYGGFYCFAFDP